MTNRRSFLKLAGAALGTAAAPRLLGAQAEPRKVRGVIWLWMDGGLPQGQTWDPKPRLTSTRAVETPIPAIRVSELLPLCAAQARHLTLLRSVSHRAGDHAVATRLLHTGGPTGRDADVPAIGTILAAELGKKDFPLPKYIKMGHHAVPTTSRFSEEFQPFLVGDNLTNPIPNLRRNVDRTRDRDRAALLLEQCREWDLLRQQPVVRKMETGLEMSEAIMNTPLLNAFNYTVEPEDLRRAYSEGFGLQCLVARRLVEAGCPFVEIGMKGWNTCRSPIISDLDRGLGTLIRDLAGKGLLRDVVVVCATEFGKAPQFALSGFQGDAWPNGFSIVLAGGALPGGRVVGDTGGSGQGCASPVSTKDLFATIYKACGVDPETTYAVEGETFKYLDGGKPVAELF